MVFPFFDLPGPSQQGRMYRVSRKPRLPRPRRVVAVADELPVRPRAGAWQPGVAASMAPAPVGGPNVGGLSAFSAAQKGVASAGVLSSQFRSPISGDGGRAGPGQSNGALGRAG